MLAFANPKIRLRRSFWKSGGAAIFLRAPKIFERFRGFLMRWSNLDLICSRVLNPALRRLSAIC